MRKRFKIVTFLIILFILTSCNSKSSNLKSKVVTNKLMENTIKANVLYDKSPSKISNSKPEIYCWSATEIEVSDFQYDYVNSELHPKDAEKKLILRIKEEKGAAGPLGHLKFYSSQSRYELFIYEQKNKNWKVYLLFDNSYQEVIIDRLKSEEDEAINSYQILDDDIYIFSANVYKISTIDYNVQKIPLPQEKSLVVQSSGRGKTFIDGDYYINARTNSNDSTFIKYNLKTGKIYTQDFKALIEKVFKVQDGYLLLITESESFVPYLAFCSDTLKEVKRINLEVKIEAGKIVCGEQGQSFTLFQNKLYGIMSIEGKNREELIVVDCNDGTILYQLEMEHKKSSDGYTLVGYQFYKEAENKLVELNTY